MKSDKFYTFMVVPHDSRGKGFSLRIPHKLLYTAIGAFVLLSFLFVSSLVYSSILSRKLVFYKQAIAKNQEQKEVIESFNQKTQEVDQAIYELVKMDKQLRKALGLKSWKGKIKLSSKIKSLVPQSEIEQISEKLELADAKLEQRKKSLAELKSWVSKIQARFAATPSRWPLNGYIASRFGYRTYPWKGFHTGIDVTGRYGAPIRATADGIVTFVGWRNAYGKTVIVKHQHGISTLYAHNSRYSVRVGQLVKKGQIICYVGTTGLTTGPHLHYEVRKGNRAVNPVAYLNLNILTASRIWRGRSY